MLKRLSPSEQISALLDQYAAAIREAFLSAIADITSKITLQLIVTRLERGDIAGAVDAIEVDRAALNPALDKIAETYAGGGNFEAGNMTFLSSPEGHRVVFRFDVRNIAAETWLKDHSSQLVTNIVADQRTAIRNALTEGMAQGNNPRATALDIVGRVSKATGTRQGGIIGLTAQQERAVALARQELSGGDLAAMRNYLTRGRRDRRFDATVRKAIDAEKPLPAETVARITGRYADGLLKLRGDMLARTESLVSLNKGRDDAFVQAAASGKIEADLVTKRWRSAGDDRVRHTHQVLNGQEVGFSESFTSPSGVQLRFPGDPNAPGSEIIGCRCVAEYKVDHVAHLLRRRAH